MKNTDYDSGFNLAKRDRSFTVYRADTFFSRLRGLLFRRVLKENEAILIQPCNAVHTYGMKYDLRIIFLDPNGKILSRSTLSPNEIKRCKGAKKVLEFRPGFASAEQFLNCTQYAVPITKYK